MKIETSMNILKVTTVLSGTLTAVFILILGENWFFGLLLLPPFISSIYGLYYGKKMVLELERMKKEKS